MKNIHLLLTDKQSRLIQKRITNELKLSSLNNPQLWNNINIYITSDEEIKDWYIYKGKLLHISTNHSKYEMLYGKPVILTTDPDLIADGVQAIDDEFLEWFVKNPSCERFEIEYQTTGLKDGIWQYDYKIIIPQEEAKQMNQMSECYFIPNNNTTSATICANCEQEKFLHTIGEGIKVSKSIIITQEKPKQLNSEDFGLPKFGTKEFNTLAMEMFGGGKPKQETLGDFIKRESKSGNESVGMVKGAKWQAERMYNEVIEFAKWIRIKDFQTTSKDNWIGLDMKYYTTQELFEQFKKK
jgi:hypothetical protein